MINKKQRHDDEHILVSQIDDDNDEQHMMMISRGLWQDNDKIGCLHDAVWVSIYMERKELIKAIVVQAIGNRLRFFF